MPIFNKIKSKPDVSLEIAVDPTDSMTPLDQMPMEGLTMPTEEPTEEELFSEFDDDDLDAVRDLGPLESLVEYIEPLAAQSSDREVINFMLQVLSSRKEMLESI